MLPTLALILAAAGSIQAHELRKGFYQPVQGNNASICPHEVKPIHNDAGKLTAIRVLYVGDCSAQGPFEYHCSRDYDPQRKLVCAWGRISFEVRGPTAYLWRNETHGIWGEFRWRAPPQAYRQ